MLSSDEKLVSMSLQAARMSKTISNLLEDVGLTVESVPLYNTSQHVLQKVKVYCDHHSEAHPAPAQPQPPKDKLEAITTMDSWDLKYLDDINAEANQEFPFSHVLELLQAANYLDIPSLLDLVSNYVAKHCLGKDVDQVRRMFNMQEPFSPQEIEAVNQEIEQRAQLI
uniref:SKP1 component dimerisation domain-containing protein n=1 Tax=Arcella intermedia TaxID=1963864 RepID=A0A6B2LLW6_9EUKA